MTGPSYVLTMAPQQRTLIHLIRRRAGSLVTELTAILPKSSQLAWEYYRGRCRGGEPELRALHRLGPNRGTAVDAGANRGLYTYRLAQLYETVWAFEPNPSLAGALAHRVPRNVHVHGCALSDRAGVADLHVPRYQGQVLDGWASLQPQHCPVAEGSELIQVATRTLDELALERVRFIKIDVEGHELRLLRGADETIRRNRPVVLIEIVDANREAVMGWLADRGYVQRPLRLGRLGLPGLFWFTPERRRSG